MALVQPPDRQSPMTCLLVEQVRLELTRYFLLAHFAGQIGRLSR
jgi:hypothetical protein